MKTISMTAYRRPEYETTVIASLLVNTPSLRQGNFLGVCRDQDGEKNIGCDNNTLKAIEGAFEEGSDFNLHLEDDTVLSPDALALCNWFYNLPERDNYVLLNLHAHSKADALERPLDVVESARFSSWGWAITRKQWETVVRPEWNAKKRFHPMGWDWSVGLTIQRHGLKTLRPVLSRVRNIGRENGTYETPEHWDEWAKDLVHSPGGFGRDFRIAERLAAMPPVDEWVTQELEA